MTITVKSNSVNNITRYHNYFCNKGLHCMKCNNGTEVTVFDLDPVQAEMLIKAFAKHFRLKRTEPESLAA